MFMKQCCSEHVFVIKMVGSKESSRSLPEVSKQLKHRGVMRFGLKETVLGN